MSDLSVVVVDDSTTILKIFKISLARYEVEIASASSYAEALNLVTRMRPQVLVVDAHLPGISGPEDLKRLQSEAGGASVLLLVGSHEAFDEKAFHARGLTHMLRKPFEAQDILRSLATILGKDVSMRASEKTEAPLVNEGSPFAIPLPTDVNPDMMAPPPPPPSMTPKIPASVNEAFSIPVKPISELTGGWRLGQSLATVEDVWSQQTAVPPPPAASPALRSSLRDEPPSIVADGLPSRAYAEAVQSAPSAPPFNATQMSDEINAKLQEFLQAEAPLVVRKFVEKYCESHFAQVAREVLTAELRRLAEEKSRLLTN